jgi:tRNA/rRNA methyltransferase
MTEQAENPPAVILVRPREEGNLGATARAMANMGLRELIVVEPGAPVGKVAEAFAVGARHILSASKRVDSLDEALAPFRRVVATTSSRDRHLGVPILDPRELPPALAMDPRGTPTALVFGPEVGGLDNEELARASLIVTIACSLEQPTLNLAQAVLIVAYELYATHRAGFSPPVTTVEPPASGQEIEGLFGDVTDLLGRVGFARDTTIVEVLRDLRRLASRAGPTSHEIAILRGVCRRSRHALQRGLRGENEGSELA